MSKTLGIIGGMGPLATATIFTNIVKLTDASKDQDHIPILINNNVLIPDRTAYILGESKDNPKNELIRSAKQLEDSGADYLIMPCNTAHYFFADIKKEINIPFLNMIELAAKEISKNKNIKKVGLLATEGTIKTRVYNKSFEKYGIEIINPTKENQKYITEIIYGIKENKRPKNLIGYNKVIDELKRKGVDIFVTGCTEMSVAIKLYELNENIIDPMDILARKSIEFSGKKIIKRV